jgi:hypothetical protein
MRLSAHGAGLDVPGARWLQVLVNITGGEDAQGWTAAGKGAV